MRLTRFGFLLALYLAGLSVPGALLAAALGPGLGGDAAVLWTVGGGTAAVALFWPLAGAADPAALGARRPSAVFVPPLCFPLVFLAGAVGWVGVDTVAAGVAVVGFAWSLISAFGVAAAARKAHVATIAADEPELTFRAGPGETRRRRANLLTVAGVLAWVALLAAAWWFGEPSSPLVATLAWPLIAYNLLVGEREYAVHDRGLVVRPVGAVVPRFVAWRDLSVTEGGDALVLRREGGLLPWRVALADLADPGAVRAALTDRAT